MTHPSYDGVYLSEFTIEEANLMGLTNRDNWKKMPKKMLMARCLSSGINAIAPDCLGNVKYTVEDIQDGLVDVQQIEDQPKEEIIEGETIEPKNIEADKKVLTLKLRKLDFTNAMIKEFAEKYNLLNDGDLLNELVTNEQKLMKLIEEFEK